MQLTPEVDALLRGLRTEERCDVVRVREGRAAEEWWGESASFAEALLTGLLVLDYAVHGTPDRIKAERSGDRYHAADVWEFNPIRCTCRAPSPTVIDSRYPAHHGWCDLETRKPRTAPEPVLCEAYYGTGERGENAERTATCVRVQGHAPSNTTGEVGHSYDESMRGK